MLLSKDTVHEYTTFVRIPFCDAKIIDTGMKIIPKLIVLCCSLLVSSGLFAQLSVLEKIDQEHSQCLQNKKKTYECARNYLRRIDSLLNTTFAGMKMQLDSPGKVQLRKNQAAWVIERNRKFHLIEVEIRQYGFSGPETEANEKEEKAKVLRDRIIYLSGWKPGKTK